MPSAAVISTTGIVQGKWQANLNKKAKKEFESKPKIIVSIIFEKIKEDKNLFFLHMPEAKAKEKSKLDH